MSNYNRAMLVIFFSIIVNVSYSMRPQTSSWIFNSGSGIDSNGGELSRSPNLASSSVSEYILSSLYSVTETVKNAASDDIAFKKLGWPLHDGQAKEESKRNRDIYQQIFLPDINEQKRQEFLQTICNREGYLLRAYHSLFTRSDGIAFAEYCIKNHSVIMNDPLKRAFGVYLERKKQEANRASGNAQKHLQLSHNQEQKTDPACQFDRNIADNIETILLKIGWSSDTRVNADKYLEKCLNVYKIRKAFSGSLELLQTVEGRASLQITESKTTNKMISDLRNCKSFIASREEWMRKIYENLPRRLDGIRLAFFCIQTHSYVMPESLQDDYRAYIKECQTELIGIFNQIDT